MNLDLSKTPISSVRLMFFILSAVPHELLLDCCYVYIVTAEDKEIYYYFVEISSYNPLNSRISKIKIEYPQAKLLVDTRYGAGDRT